RLGARAAARTGPSGMVPAEAGGARVEEPVAGRAEGDRPSDIAEVGGLAPPVHRRALNGARRAASDGRGARAVALGRRVLLGRDLTGEGPVALRRAEEHPVVARAREQQAQARRGRPVGDAALRDAHQVARRYLTVDV